MRAVPDSLGSERLRAARCCQWSWFMNPTLQESKAVFCLQTVVVWRGASNGVFWAGPNTDEFVDAPSRQFMQRISRDLMCPLHLQLRVRW